MNKEIILKTKPLSVNAAWKGRRYKTDLYKAYETELLYLLKRKEKIGGWVEVKYTFHINTFKKSDVGNFEKPLSDILVKAGIIDDDRFIKQITLIKEQSDKDYIEIEIKKIK